MLFLAEVIVTLRPVVNDPPGLVVRDGLHRLGFEQVHVARLGKYIELELEAEDAEAARAAVREMCERLLRNPVIEDYRIEVRHVAVSTAAGG